MKGLSNQQAQKLLQENGPNSLEEKNTTTWYKVLASQLSNVLIWILAAAGIISFVADEMMEFYFISAIILIIAVMGFLQEWKAEQAMQRLKEMTSPTVSVYRDDKLQEIESKDLVVGDIIKLEMGDKIPADAKIISSVSLRIDESILTGESNAVSKQEGEEIYSATTIVHGRAQAKVTATGMNSQLGKIAGQIQQEQRKTPLQKKIDSLGAKLGIIAIITSITIFGLGVADGAPLATILLVALALTVASIPEALPLTLTLTLSLGMRDMAKKNAIIKRMLAVEGLGATTVICTDKTGTLTKNEMTATTIYVDQTQLGVSGSGYDPTGEITHDNKPINAQEHPSLHALLQAAALCNNSQLQEENGQHNIQGEPTEGALSVLATKAGINIEELNNNLPREYEHIFTSERKMMSTIHTSNSQTHAYLKGAPEVILEKSTKILINGQEQTLTEEHKKELLSTNKTFAQQALRVLAIAQRKNVQADIKNEQAVEQELTIIGLIGLIDPPRDEVSQAIKECAQAGIRVKMITGDNPITAQAIAQQIGLSNNPEVLLGEDIEEMSDRQLQAAVKKTDIYARTKPEHKLRIVEALQANDEVVAMTGDGVNDAPAIKKADIGIGMGKKGTDVTKESADMILQDDNFSTIVVAVRDGRRIYDNIEKFTTYLISRNFTEVTIIALGAFILGFEYLPLLALQILFLNVIGQEMPAIALGLDPATKGIMDRPPRNPKQQLLHKRNLFLVSSMAVFMALTGFSVFMISNPLEHIDLARTILFASIVMMILAHSFNFRSLTHSIKEVGMLGNKWILWAVGLTIPILVATIHIPYFADWFNHVAMSPQNWLLAAAAAALTVAFIEVLKKVANKLYPETY